MFKTALIIEDDLQMAQLISKAVKSLGFEVQHCQDGKAGLEAALTNDFAFVVLDLMLPTIDGIDVCKMIRGHNKLVPIIVLTAISEELNTALLLELGADDYVTKPYRETEFKARIRTILRRYSRTDGAENPKGGILQFGELEIDGNRRKITRRGELVNLTAREFDLVFFLASHAGKPFSREQLNAAVYGHEVVGYERSITSQMNRIRAKLEPDPTNPTYIVTLRGVGYLFNENN